MAKKLTAPAINKEYSKYNERTTIPIMNGKYEITIAKYFKKSDIAKLILDYISLREELNTFTEKKYTFDDVTFLFSILLIKYFSNLELPSSADELMAFVNKLVDLEILGAIVDALPVDQVKQVNKWLDQALKNLPETLKLLGVGDNADIGSN